MMGLPGRERSSTISVAVCIKYSSVTDRRKNTCRQLVPRLRIASRGNNNNNYYYYRATLCNYYNYYYYCVVVVCCFLLLFLLHQIQTTQTVSKSSLTSRSLERNFVELMPRYLYQTHKQHVGDQLSGSIHIHGRDYIADYYQKSMTFSLFRSMSTQKIISRPVHILLVILTTNTHTDRHIDRL